jgi:hypothetical protein
MSYIPTIVVDDDNKDVLTDFREERENCNVDIKTFETWDKTEQYLRSGNIVDAIVLDARGQITKDDDVGDDHIFVALQYVKNAKIPYVIYTAHSEEELGLLKQEYQQGKVLDKAGTRKKTAEDVINYLKKEIANSPQLDYPEPFACFGDKYLDIKYLTLLKNVVLILQNKEINDAENLLFNPCRIILEQVFKRIADMDNTILPYELLNFDKQQAGLRNCHKHLGGIPYYLKNVKKYPTNYFRDSGNEIISKQIDVIITGCHPASHEIQNYSPYTLKSVLWALFDVLIWLKDFIDDGS